MVGRPSTSTLLTDRRGSSRAPGRQSFIQEATARITASAAHTSCSKGSRRGILFVNGVPRRGGGIRPPLNGTRLVAPEGRGLSPGEKYLIESGTAMVVRLPNGTELRIDAD